MIKKRVIYKISLYLFLILPPLLISGTGNRIKNEEETVSKGRDLEAIREEGKLKVVTDFSSVNYFIYKGKPMGFQYELLQELSDHLGLEIEVRVNNDLKENFNSLIHGEVDLIASNLTITPERQKLVGFILPHSESGQVLVQASPKSNTLLSREELIEDGSELSGKTVYVQQNSSHASLLKKISGSIGGHIRVVEVPIETEQLIRMVARGEIAFTVADEDVALVNQRQLKSIHVQTVLSPPESQAWAVRKDADQLTAEINAWMSEFRNTRKFAILQNKYYKSHKTSELYHSSFNYSESGRISPYDEIFRQESEKIGWDWRLIASVVYQESRFNPGARSYAGAFGLMQLMPATAERFGVDQYSSAREQIKAGIRFISWLDQNLESAVPDRQERIKFVLASYNMGMGHISDAMRLAEKYGMNPGLWDHNVETFLLKKAEKEYYSDPVVKYGFARGLETTRYVREVLYRYNHYLNLSEPAELAQIVQ